MTIISIRQRDRREREEPPSAISKETQRLALYDTAVFALWLVTLSVRILELHKKAWMFGFLYGYAIFAGMFFGVDYWLRYRTAKRKELDEIRRS